MSDPGTTYRTRDEIQRMRSTHDPIRGLQRYIEDPLSEALIAGNLPERPAFLEVYLENNQLFYRPVSPDGPTDEPAMGLALTAV